MIASRGKEFNNNRVIHTHLKAASNYNIGAVLPIRKARKFLFRVTTALLSASERQVFPFTSVFTVTLVSTNLIFNTFSRAPHVGEQRVLTSGLIRQCISQNVDGRTDAGGLMCCQWERNCISLSDHKNHVTCHQRWETN